jgi:hypothetical protein
MNNSNNTLVIVVLVVLAYYVMNSNNNYESFYDLSNNSGIDCLDCYYKKQGDCLNCKNCGLCVTDKCTTCIPGDENGPYFSETCNKWIFNGQTSKSSCNCKNSDNKNIGGTRPWSWYYNHEKTIRYPAPVRIAGV